MTRFAQLAPQTATGKAKTLLDAVKAKMGLVPNMTRAMANAPSVLEGYLGLSGALAGGALTGQVREQLALAVAQKNGCDYCLAAHSTIGKMVGLTPDQIRESRHASAGDARTAALLAFAGRIVDSRGRVPDQDVAAARAAGWTDGELAEVVGHVALNVFTNYFNLVAGTDVDFPAAVALEPLQAASIAR